MESWEDWENQDWDSKDLSIKNEPVKPSEAISEAQAKRAEEQRLIEESETALVHDLFLNKPPSIIAPEKKRPDTYRPKQVNKQAENEQKQKVASDAAKMLKVMKERERELFVEIEEDELDVKYDYYN